jgi:NADH-quinone oxidoreductase subunit E
LPPDVTPKIGPTADADSEAIKERIRGAVESQKRPTVTVLSSLLAIEDELGYIPEEAIEMVASHSDATINEVWGVASFYPNFRFTPPSDHLVEVCWGPSCHLVGATEVIQSVLGELGLDGEGDTSDGNATMKLNTCLGACSQAPVMSIDHRLMGRISPEAAGSRVAALKGS